MFDCTLECRFLNNKTDDRFPTVGNVQYGWGAEVLKTLFVLVFGIRAVSRPPGRSCHCDIVQHSGTAFRRAVVALSTHARRLFVLVQVRLERERLATAPAHERFLDGVGLDVSTEVRLVGECLAALRALERFLARMCADVSLQ